MFLHALPDCQCSVSIPAASQCKQALAEAFISEVIPESYRLPVIQGRSDHRRFCLLKRLGVGKLAFEGHREAWPPQAIFLQTVTRQESD
jgi:hypothetical protein